MIRLLQCSPLYLSYDQYKLRKQLLNKFTMHRAWRASSNSGILMAPHVSRARTSAHFSHMVAGPSETILFKPDIKPS